MAEASAPVTTSEGDARDKADRSLSGRPSEIGTKGLTPFIIEASGLTKRFGELTAVNRVSFGVRRAEVFAFLGPNGAGKSTTIKMLTTLLLPTEGKLFINGHDPVVEPDAARRSFGIVFQDPSLDDELTAYENLFFHAGLYGIPRNRTPGRIKEMLDFVDLYDRRGSLVKTFSGGMKRRLEIARGLLHTPSVFFLDEPTVGLDPQTRNHIWEYLKKLNHERGLTVFFTTHYMEEVERVADRAAIIDHGNIITIGEPKAIVAESGTASLEDAFIKLTGHVIREQEAGAIDYLRTLRQARQGRRR